MSDEIDTKVLRKYEIHQRLGKGAYGIVWKATNKKSGKTVALKKIFDAFQNSTDAQRTFREIMFLQELDGHKNIIRLLNVIKAKNDNDIYLEFDFMESDLHAVVKADILEPVHKKYIIYQVVKALKYLHSAELLHRDIKPSNVLLNSECHVKICDFGLARSVASKADEKNANVLTDYVATRWYRAPEILLGSTTYTKGVDIWSIACIIAELIGGKPLFPGSSTMNQLDRILEVTGFPSVADQKSIQSPYSATMLDGIGRSRPSTKLVDRYPDCDPDAIDLMKRILQFNPSKRPSAEEILSHPFLKDFHNPNEERDAPRPISIPMDDNVRFSVEDYRGRLYDDIHRKKKELKKSTAAMKASSEVGQRVK
jgi:mitogen-activated protein kinase 15